VLTMGKIVPCLVALAPVRCFASLRFMSRGA
jgi:hypothetical protein